MYTYSMPRNKSRRRGGKRRKGIALLSSSHAKYLDTHVDPGRQNINLIAKNSKTTNVSRFACQAYGSTGLLNTHCYPRGKSFTSNVGQNNLEQLRRIPPDNRAYDTTADSLAKQSGFDSGRTSIGRSTGGKGSRKRRARALAKPDKLSSFADKARILAMTGMSG